MNGLEQIGSYKFMVQTGQGAFGRVFLAEHVITKDHVAIKCIPKCNTKSSALRRFQIEVSLLKKIDHPMIVQLFQVLEDANYHYLVMEFVPKNSLSSVIKTNGRMIEPTARKYFLQLISTLEYLHNDMKIAHRDLKAENVLLDKYNNIRLADFGVSRTFTETTPTMNTDCGTLVYLPPEMILKQPYTTMADIWSAGVLLYFMLVGRFPFDSTDANQVAYRILHCPAEFPKSLSPAVIDLLKKMLQKRPEDRIRLEKIKEHPWFSCMEYHAMKHRLEEVRESSSKFDTEIVRELERFGIDTSSLKHKLFLHDFEDEAVAIYRIRHRMNVTEEIRSLTMFKSGSSGYLPSSPTPPPPPTQIINPRVAPSPLVGPFPEIKRHAADEVTAVARPVVMSRLVARNDIRNLRRRSAVPR